MVKGKVTVAQTVFGHQPVTRKTVKTSCETALKLTAVDTTQPSFKVPFL